MPGEAEINGCSASGVIMKTDGGVPAFLRTLALVAAVAGFVGSEILVVRAGGGQQRLLTVIFIVWIGLPFVALAWANMISTRWPAVTRVALFGTTILIALGSVAFFGGVILPPAGSPRAYVFVMGPLAAWALMLIVVPISALIARKR
jgi:hypothetical protein